MIWQRIKLAFRVLLHGEQKSTTISVLRNRDSRSRYRWQEAFFHL